MSHSTAFTPAQNFQTDSYMSRCPITGSARGEDEFIFRGPMIFESVPDGKGGFRDVVQGFFDVKVSAIADAASKHLGMLTPEESLQKDNDIAELAAELLQTDYVITDLIAEAAFLRKEVATWKATAQDVYDEFLASDDVEPESPDLAEILDGMSS